MEGKGTSSGPDSDRLIALTQICGYMAVNGANVNSAMCLQFFTNALQCTGVSTNPT